MYLRILLWSAYISAVHAASLPSARNSSYRFGVPSTNATYDYVVVGGGNAGLVIATRLAENTSLSVAVIEAGGFYEADVGNISTTPAYDVLFTGTNPNDTNPSIDWGFVTEPQPGAGGRILHYARGKTLGGSSARHFMIYHRPTVGSMQRWAREVGDSVYTFSQFLRYFKKSVHYTPPSIVYRNSTNSQDSSAFSATGGPLQVSFGKYEDPFGTWAQLAFKSIGQAAIRGFQLGKLIGSAYAAFSVDPTTGQRSSSESSFLQSFQGPNLFVYNNTLAQRILFTGNQNKAAGVLVSPDVSSTLDQKTGYTLRARKEVIVSAGAFQSPQLLMVSGIGPRAALEQHNIPVLKDLPGVGQNLQDQPVFGTTYRVSLTTGSAALNNASINAANIAAFTQQQTGPLTNPSVPVLGWENLPHAIFSRLSRATRKALSSFPSDWPQLEFLPIGAVFNTPTFATGDPLDGYNYASVATVIITPLSTGNISISSTSMTDPPVINPNWLTDPADLELAVAAFKRQRQFWAYLVSRNITIGEEWRPGPSVSTDAQILEYIRRTMAPIWHAASTCKMGKKEDAMAVVDTEARVYGTKGLRVVDASAFPFLPPGHPQSVVYALAEKVAEDILRGR